MRAPISLSQIEERFVDSFMAKDIEYKSAQYWLIVRNTLEAYQTGFKNRTSLITNAVLELCESILEKIYMRELDLEIDNMLEN